MEDEIVIENITLFRCYSCGTLITVNDVEDGSCCHKCSSRRMVTAKSVTFEENLMLEQMYRAGTLKLFLSGATP